MTSIEVSSPDTERLLYAHVALDVQARDLKDRLFTYLVPEHFREDAFVGAQVLVPFGPQGLVAGYVVSLAENIETTTGNSFQIKEIADVLAPEPLFDARYISLLNWLADYYCASISDVIQAAVPSIVMPRLKRVVKLHPAMATRALDSDGTVPGDEAASAIVDLLSGAKSGKLAMTALKQRFHRATHLKQGRFFRALNFLRQEGIVTIEQETSTAQAPKTAKAIVLTGREPTTKRQAEIVHAVMRQGGQMLLKDLLEETKASSSTINKLVRDGVALLIDQEMLRDPLAHVNDKDNVRPKVELTQHQQAAFDKLMASLGEKLEGERSGDNSPYLLHGVTGSGKTEIYLRLIEETTRRGKSALLLVPEISLTPQLARLLKQRFGEQVAVWHSALSHGERYDTWRRLRAGDVKVLLGARSAVLVYMPDLALIIMDEEHDGSYKQSSPNPRYHAKEVVLERARRENALVLLGSATPDVATYFQAQASGRVLTLPERVFKQALPAVNIVDMRQEFADGNRSVISHVLDHALQKCLLKKEQAILLINRRGYANHVFCRACGFVVKCKNCSVSLVYHQTRSQSYPNADGYLSCHHCGFSCGNFPICPACRSPFIKQYGLGTQRVEEEIRVRYPNARTLRLDSDVARGKGAHDAVLTDFSAGKADILIGTQMVSKGLDIANVTLVGVLAADAVFNLPDYRSVERGFQLLTQVAGRAGRGERPGQVIFQTFNSEMPALSWAKNHDFAQFMTSEIESRKAFQYPPFSQLIRIVVAGNDPVETESECERLAEEIGRYLEDESALGDIKILGPAPCLIERLRGKYRFHLLIKNMAGDAGRAFLSTFLRRKRTAHGLTMAVDIDAIDLL
ncbi:MAG TPA: primosomal protein N' [Candidatus Obscuribacterales bacterium]